MKKHPNWTSAGLLIAALTLALFPSPAFAAPATQDDDPKAEADRMYNEGVGLSQSGQTQAALEKFEMALPLYQKAGDRFNEALCWLAIGFAREHMADDAGALEAYQASLPIWREIGERNGEGATLTNLSDLYRRQGNLRAALDYRQQALAIWRKTGFREAEGVALNTIGLIYRELGQYVQAQEHYQQALAIARDLRNRDLEGAALDNLGAVYNRLGQYEQSLDYHQQALAIVRETDDWESEAWVLNNLGSPYENQGRYEQALNAYQQARGIFQDHQHREGEEATLNNVGGVYRALGQSAQAIDYFQQALNIAREIHDGEGEGAALNNLGVTYDNLGQYPQALDYYQQALAIAQGSGRRAEEAKTLSNIGLAYEGLGQYTQALDYLQQALTIGQEVGDRKGAASTLTNLGTVFYHLEQPALALEHYQQALTVFQSVGDRAGEGVTLNDIGKTYLDQGDSAQAIQAFRQAVDVFESIQGEINVEELKVSFADQQAETYQRLVNLLWEAGRFEEAFTYAERARARAFLDGLAGGAVDFRAGADAALLKREQALRAEIATLRAQRLALLNRPGAEQDTDAIAATDAELAAREADYAQLLTDIKLQSPEVASLVSVDVALLADVQALLDADTTLVEYFVTADHTLAFLITYTTFEAVAVDVSRDDLAQIITTFRDFASLDDPHPASLKQLHAWLIAPLKDALKTSAVGIIPHGVLHYLPFAALTDGERYLSDNYALFTLPSASVLRFIQAKRKANADTVLALGNPTINEPGLSILRFAEQEVETIARLYGMRARVDGDATESTVWSQAGDAGIVHLAAHGKYNPYNPLFSTIYLASDSENDGRLEVHEVYGLDLTKATDLVVLSACQTDVGAVSAGDEVVGLNRAFLYAGAPTVIASLWNVDDAATALLMERFYTHWRAGVSKGEALRQAQAEARAKYPHPYYWAAFVLTGDAGGVTGKVISSEATQVVAAADRTATEPTPAGDGGGLCWSAALSLGIIVLAGVSWMHRLRKTKL